MIKLKIPKHLKLFAEGTDNDLKTLCVSVNPEDSPDTPPIQHSACKIEGNEIAMLIFEDISPNSYL